MPSFGTTTHLESFEPETDQWRKDASYKHGVLFGEKDLVRYVMLKMWCLFCNKLIPVHGFRSKEHLAGCDQVPEDVRIAMQQPLDLENATEARTQGNLNGSSLSADLGADVPAHEARSGSSVASDLKLPFSGEEESVGMSLTDNLASSPTEDEGSLGGHGEPRTIQFPILYDKVNPE